MTIANGSRGQSAKGAFIESAKGAFGYNPTGMPDTFSMTCLYFWIVVSNGTSRFIRAWPDGGAILYLADGYHDNLTHSSVTFSVGTSTYYSGGSGAQWTSADDPFDAHYTGTSCTDVYGSFPQNGWYHSGQLNGGPTAPTDGSAPTGITLSVGGVLGAAFEFATSTSIGSVCADTSRKQVWFIAQMSVTNHTVP